MLADSTNQSHQSGGHLHRQTVTAVQKEAGGNGQQISGKALDPIRFGQLFQDCGQHLIEKNKQKTLHTPSTAISLVPEL